MLTPPSSVIGAAIGGTLAEPAKNYPALFPAGSLFDRFPYLLPNLVCTAVVVFGLVVGCLFLRETHEDAKHRRDPGTELGDWLLTLAGRLASRARPLTSRDDEKAGYPDETLAFLADKDEHDDGSRSCDLASDGAVTDNVVSPLPTRRSELRQAFSGQIMIRIAAFGILALYVCGGPPSFLTLIT